MIVECMGGETFQVESVFTLEEKLKTLRKDKYGAFVLSRQEDGPSLWINVNNNIAYIHYFTTLDGSHPGFQPADMNSADFPESVHFWGLDGESDSFDMPNSTLVPVELAYLAAKEYFEHEGRPKSIQWFEL